MRALALVVALGLASCVESQLLPCDDSACALGHACYHGECATEQEAAVCDSIADGEKCSALLVTRGVCLNQICRESLCGDGHSDAYEACDDGNLLDGDQCAANCASDLSCGNGILDPGEKCDDNNHDNGDGCQANCAVSTCGDAIVDQFLGEICDDGNNEGGDGCAANCRSDETCGNGLVDLTRLGQEECDVGAANSDAPGANCRTNCTRQRCGDSIVDPGERCDAGLENRNEPDALCRTDCQPTRCSDGVLDSSEVCDDGNNTLGDGCAADCQSTEVCGNGVLDPVTPSGPEQCDDAIAGLSSDGCSSKCDLEFGNWAPLQQTQPEPRTAPIYAVDTDRKRLVMFGGLSAANTQLNDTWSYDGVAWRPVFTPTTPVLAAAPSAMAYDPIGHVMIAYAGATQTTWRFDGFDWKVLTTAHHPEARSGFSMASAPAQGGVMLFGGRRADVALVRQTYVFANGDWQLVSNLGPSPREDATMTYSESWGVMLFGGYNGTTNTRDTWTYEAAGWRLLDANGPAVVRCVITATSFMDPLLQGGTAGSSFNDRVYFFDGEWLAVPLASAGVKRTSHVFAALDANNAVVFGGNEPSAVSSTVLAAGTVNFDITTRKFTTVNPTLAGVPTRGAAVYDSARGVVVVLTPVEGVPEPRFGTMKTWEFDGYAWREIRTPTALPIRSSYGMAYAPELGQVLVFGGTGFNGGALDDLWLYDGANWIQPDITSERPMARREHYFGNLPGVGLVALGGVSNAQNTNDVWLLQLDINGFAWTQLQPTSAGPTDFFDVVGAYDAMRRALVLQLHTQDGFETWLFNGDWTKLPIDTVAVAAPALAYDPTRRSVVLFGGVAQNGLRTNTYELTDQWREVRMANAPPASAFGQMVFHDASKHMMLIGGRQGFGDSNETWLKSFTSARTAPDACMAGVDSDLDGLIACGDATHRADPDCWPLCDPQCPPTLGAPTCVGTQRCGDGSCAILENYIVCPADCPPPP